MESTPQKIVLITGATSGIGEATARKFAEAGHDLILTGRRKDRLDRIAEQLRKEAGRQVLPLVFDVRSRSACEKAVNSIPGEWKQIAIFVNNAGLAAGRDAVQSANLDDWDEMVDTNVKGLLYMIRFISPVMIANGFGHIINMGSVAGREAYAGGSVYCGTKWAVEGISRAMRLDLLEYGIRVTNICPGLVETEFSVVRFKGDEQRAKSVYEGMNPLTATDIADSIFWAASRPMHVNIDEIVMTARAQGDSRTVVRGKGY